MTMCTLYCRCFNILISMLNHYFTLLKILDIYKMQVAKYVRYLYDLTTLMQNYNTSPTHT